jgi:tetratricopeptide (TPR) repeat protein
MMGFAMVFFKHISWVFILGAVCTGGHAQQVVAMDEAMVKQVDSLNARGKELMGQLKYVEAGNVYELADAVAEKGGYVRGEGIAVIGMGDVTYSRRNFIAAEEYGKRAIAKLRDSGLDTLLAKAHIIWGEAVWAQSRFDEAILAFDSARMMYSAREDTAGVGAAYRLLAMAEEERGNYDKSFQYAIKSLGYRDQGAYLAIGQLYADVGDYQSALEYFGKVTDRSLVVLIDQKVGETYALQKNYDSAMYYYRIYLSSLGGDSRITLSKPNLLIGELYLAKGKVDSAEVYLKTALDGFRFVHDRNWTMRSLLSLGRTYKEAGRPAEGLEYGRELLSLAGSTGARQYARDGHFLLYELFQEQGLTDSSFMHLQTYTLLNNAIGIEMSAQKLAFFKGSADLEQAELKIDLLNRERELQQAEIRRTSQEKLFLLLGVMALLLVLVILGRNFFLKKRSAEQSQRLAESELEMQKLEHTRRLSELEMQVLRVQMNPHFIFNSLNSINRFILRNSALDASDYLTKFSRLVRLILQNSRSGLITLENELDSLRLYLELEALRFDHEFTFEIVVAEGLDIGMIKVPPLVIQPFVENAIWHGLMPKRAQGRIKIKLSMEAGLLVVKIVDDGVGRSGKAGAEAEGQVSTHRPLGLSVTSQRLGMMYGAVTEVSPVRVVDLVDASGNPAGTEVTVKMPLQYD